MFALYIISAINGLVVGGCHFQAFWVGSKPSRSIFFEIFGAKKQKEKTGKNRKLREKSEKRNFGGDILSISTGNQNFAEISEILFPGYL